MTAGCSNPEIAAEEISRLLSAFDADIRDMLSSPDRYPSITDLESALTRLQTETSAVCTDLLQGILRSAGDSGITAKKKQSMRSTEFG